MHAKIRTAKNECSVRSFSVLVSSRWRSDAHARAPEEKLLFLVYFQNQTFFDTHTFLSSFSLGLLFLKKNNSEEEEEEEKKRKKRGKKSFTFPVLPSLKFYTHTHTKNAQKRRSKTERRRAALK